MPGEPILALDVLSAPAAAAVAAPHPVADGASRYRSAFLSYASADRDAGGRS